MNTPTKENEMAEASDRDNGSLADLSAEFTRCLGVMSSCRAGWDYQLSPAQRAKEDREEATALARARAIWSEHPAHHEALRAAFFAASPLASMSEIEGDTTGRTPW